MTTALVVTFALIGTFLIGFLIGHYMQTQRSKDFSLVLDYAIQLDERDKRLTALAMRYANLVKIIRSSETLQDQWKDFAFMAGLEGKNLALTSEELADEIGARGWWELRPTNIYNLKILKKRHNL